MKNFLWLFVFVLDTVELATGKVFQATAGKTVVLECGVDSYTAAVSWHHGNEKIIGQDRRFGIPRRGQIELVSRSQLRETQLSIRNVKEEDAGPFSCISDGKQYEHRLLVFSVSARPSSELELNSEAELHCRVKGGISGSTVQWMSPNGPVNKEKVISSVALSDAGTWFCMISENGISYKESLTIVVKVPATTKPSPTENSKSNHKPDSTPWSTKDPLSWWIWVAVGVGCFVVILLMTCVIVLCKRLQRRKKKHLRMKNGRLRPTQYCKCNTGTAAARPQHGRRKEKPSALPLQPVSF